MGRSNIDTLPLELREKIVSFTSFSQLLSIKLVSKALLQACESTAVLKQLINNRNSHGGPIWQHSHLSAESTHDQWARYALADDKAFYIRLWEAEFDDNTMRYLPQLVVTKRTYIWNWDGTDELTSLRPYRQSI